MISKLLIRIFDALELYEAKRRANVHRRFEKWKRRKQRLDF